MKQVISWLRRGRDRATPGGPAKSADLPYPPHGPVTALSVLEFGFDVTLDASREQVIGRAKPPHVDVHLPIGSISRRHAVLKQIPEGLEITDCSSRNGIGLPPFGLTPDYPRSERVVAKVGSRFVLGSVELLTLDDLTHRLVPRLARHLGTPFKDDIGRALEAVMSSRMLVLRSKRTDEYGKLGRAIHAHSIRREHPFTHVAKPPTDEACEKLCLQGSRGMVLLDMSRPFPVPLPLARNLLSQRFDVWTVVMTPESAEDALFRFGAALVEPKPPDFGICMVGFSGPYWRGQGFMRW